MGNATVAERLCRCSREELAVRLNASANSLMRDFHAISVTLTHSQTERVGVDPMSGEKDESSGLPGRALNALPQGGQIPVLGVQRNGTTQWHVCCHQKSRFRATQILYAIVQ